MYEIETTCYSNGEEYQTYVNEENYDSALKTAKGLENEFFVSAVNIKSSSGAELYNSSDDTELKKYEQYSYDDWCNAKQGHHEKSDKPSVYFDMDGTLAYWNNGKDLEEILNPANHYFRDLEPHPAMIELAKKLQEDGADVCIISAADRNLIKSKWEWLEEHMPFIPKENICFCPIGADKSQFVKGNAEKSILIDDYKKNLEIWKGTPIKAINTVNSYQKDYYNLDIIKPCEIENRTNIPKDTMYYMKKSVGGTLDSIYYTNCKEFAKEHTKEGYTYISHDKFKEYDKMDLAVNYDYDYRTEEDLILIAEEKKILDEMQRLELEQSKEISEEQEQKQENQEKEQEEQEKEHIEELQFMLIIYDFDGNFDFAGYFPTQEEAVEKTELFEDNRDCIGTCVYNLKELKPKFTSGNFPLDIAFTPAVLCNNGDELNKIAEKLYSQNDDKEATKIITYHGTKSKEDFDTFRPDYRGAIWSDTEERFAQNFASLNGKVLTCEVEYKNPAHFEVGSKENWDIDKVIYEAESAGHDAAIIDFKFEEEDNGYINFLLENYPDFPAREAFSGNIYFSELDAKPDESISEFMKRMGESNNITHSYIAVFNPEQIKVVGNEPLKDKEQHTEEKKKKVQVEHE